MSLIASTYRGFFFQLELLDQLIHFAVTYYFFSFVSLLCRPQKKNKTRTLLKNVSDFAREGNRKKQIKINDDKIEIKQMQHQTEEHDI